MGDFSQIQAGRDAFKEKYMEVFSDAKNLIFTWCMNFNRRHERMGIDFITMQSICSIGNYSTMDLFIKAMKEKGYSFKTVDTIPQ